MRILLILHFAKAYQIIPDLGLGYLGSVLRREGHDVDIVDCVNRNFNNNKLVSYIKRNKFDVVGFKVFTKDLDTVREAARDIKNFDKSIITVAGGPHPSCNPKQTLEYINDLDFVIFGEGEKNTAAINQIS